MPTLADTLTGSPPIWKGRDSASTMWSAISSASDGSRMPSMSTANSSPPRRAAVSPARSVAASRREAAMSRWSPTVCPSVSLTTLKSSRSMKSALTSVPPRSRRPLTRERSIRFSSRTRLGRPVSESWKARCVSSRSSFRWSVTSRRVSTSPRTLWSWRRLLHLTSTSTRRWSWLISCQSSHRSCSRSVSRIWSSARAARPASSGWTRSVRRQVPCRSSGPNTASAEGLA